MPNNDAVGYMVYGIRLTFVKGQQQKDVTGIFRVTSSLNIRQTLYRTPFPNIIDYPGM